MAVSNMIGPLEKIAMDGNPIKSFSFFVTGAPQVSKQTAYILLAIFFFWGHEIKAVAVGFYYLVYCFKGYLIDK